MRPVGRADPVFRQVPQRCRRQVHPPGGDSGVGPGRSRLSAVLAGGNGCVRDRPAGGARVQGRHARGTEGSTNGRRARRADRSPPRLAGRAARRRVRHREADGVDRRGAAAVSAIGRPGSPAGQHHRPQRRREPPGFGGCTEKVSTAIRRANRTSATMSTPIWRSRAGSRRKRRPISCSPTQACRRFRRSTAR